MNTLAKNLLLFCRPRRPFSRCCLASRSYACWFSSGDISPSSSLLQVPIESLSFSTFVVQSPLTTLTSLFYKKCNLLKARVVIYACKHHVRLLSPEPVVVETTTVYPGQGADIVMQSQSVHPQASLARNGKMRMKCMFVETSKRRGVCASTLQIEEKVAGRRGQAAACVGL